MSEAAALPQQQNDDDDDLVVVIDGHQADQFRLFPERVYEMVSKEAVGVGVIRWEAEHKGGQAFSIARNSPALSGLLQRYFGPCDRLTFQSRLIKYGWDRVRSESPETHTAYWHPRFHKDRLQAKLASIKRQRRSSPCSVGQKRSAEVAQLLQAGQTTASTTSPPPKRPARRQRTSTPTRNNGNSYFQLKQEVSQKTPTDADGKPKAKPQIICIEDDDGDDSDIEVVLVVNPSPPPAAAAAKKAPQVAIKKSPTKTASAATPTTTPTKAAKPLQSPHTAKLPPIAVKQSPTSPVAAKQSPATSTLKQSPPTRKPPPVAVKQSSTPPIAAKRPPVASLLPAKVPSVARAPVLVGDIVLANPFGRWESDNREPALVLKVDCGYATDAYNTTSVGHVKQSADNRYKKLFDGVLVKFQLSNRRLVVPAAAVRRLGEEETTSSNNKPSSTSSPSATVSSPVVAEMAEMAVKRAAGAVMSEGASSTDDEGPSSPDAEAILSAAQAATSPQTKNDCAESAESYCSDSGANATLPEQHTHEPSTIHIDDDTEMEKDQLNSLASHVWDSVLKETALRRQNLATQRLQEKRDKVVSQAWHRQQQSNKPLIHSKRLAATQNALTSSCHQQKQASFWLAKNGERMKTTVPAVRLDGTDKAQPRHNAPVNVSRWRSAPDKTELDFVPYFRDVGDDEEHEFDLAEAFTTKHREKKLVRGATYREEETNANMDLAFDRLCRKFWRPDSKGRFQLAKLETIRQPLSYAVGKVTGINDEWIQERYEVLLGKARIAQQQPAQAESDFQNFRDLFCNRCFIYSCDIHGLADKPSMQLQYEKGRKRMEGDFWEDAEFQPSKLKSNEQQVLDQSDTGVALSDSKKELCKKLFYMFGGDASKISAALIVPLTLVTDLIVSNAMKLPQCRLYGKSRASQPPTKGKYHSMRNYKAKWLSMIIEAKNHPWCEPCSHDEPCSDENCSCVQDAFFCTKACAHAEYSRNFFRGCDCKAACSQTACSCLAANRECDPDLCKTCGACTDPPGFQESPKQKCRNDSISMRRHRRLLVAKSTIPNAGWGLFTKHALKKGDFVHEYVGELVSSDEAERRGLLYDKHGCTYLFEQSADYVIDGMDKANNVRFANHSVSPNVEAKKMFVSGDIRIGYFAYENIKAQEELFIDYSDTKFKGNFMVSNKEDETKQLAS